MLLWSDIFCCIIWNFKSCSLAVQKSLLSQHQCKCRGSAEISSDSLCHRLWGQAQHQLRQRQGFEEGLTKVGEKRRKHKKRRLKLTLIFLIIIRGAWKIACTIFWRTSLESYLVITTELFFNKKKIMRENSDVNSTWKK